MDPCSSHFNSSVFPGMDNLQSPNGPTFAAQKYPRSSWLSTVRKSSRDESPPWFPWNDETLVWAVWRYFYLSAITRFGFSLFCGRTSFLLYGDSHQIIIVNYSLAIVSTTRSHLFRLPAKNLLSRSRHLRFPSGHFMNVDICNRWSLWFPGF